LQSSRPVRRVAELGLGGLTRMHTRPRFWLFATVALFLSLPAHALTIVPPERPAGHHDWRVDSKDGTKSYGVAGDRSETYIWYGASFFRVRVPFVAVVACTALLPVVFAGFIWRAHRHGNAASGFVQPLASGNARSRPAVILGSRAGRA